MTLTGTEMMRTMSPLLDQVARRGQEHYESHIRPQLTPEDEGKFVLIDVESGEFEIDSDELAASDRLRLRTGEATYYGLVVGCSSAVSLTGGLAKDGSRDR